MADQDDVLQLIEDSGRVPEASTARKWKVAVIDDDQAVHEGTRFALSDYNLNGQTLEILSAYSAAEGRKLMRTHPDSGIKSIYINPIRIEGILGLDHKEALPLLADLLAHATQERFQYRHHWQPGDLVIWDNRCLLHKANGDYDMGQTRYLYRIMLKGDAPT